MGAFFEKRCIFDGSSVIWGGRFLEKYMMLGHYWANFWFVRCPFLNGANSVANAFSNLIGNLQNAHKVHETLPTYIFMNEMNTTRKLSRTQSTLDVQQDTKRVFMGRWKKDVDVSIPTESTVRYVSNNVYGKQGHRRTWARG